MAYQRQTPGDRGVSLFGAINIGSTQGGGTLSLLKRGAFSASSAAIAQFASLTTEVALSGATTGDFAIVYGATALNAGLTLESIAPCVATSQILVTFINHTSASVTMTTELPNRYILVKLST